MEQKKKSSLARLMHYAGKYKYFTYASWLLSAVSAVLALMPFYYVWKIIKEVIDVMPNFAQAQSVVKNGWLAVLFAVLSILIYICALMSSHVAAFRVQANLRRAMMRRIVSLPLGTVEGIGSGKLRKTVNECSESTETYLAHQLPDMIGSYVTPLGLLVFLFAFDWRFGLFSLIPVILSFAIMTVFMTGNNLKVKMREYQNALDDMSNEAVEYVRGIPVVKTFGQSVFSFKKFKKAIDAYSKWTISYTKSLRMPMVLFTMLINGIFAFILLAGMIFSHGEIEGKMLLDILFYIIITPVLTLNMNRIMYQSENKMLLDDAIARIDGVLDLQPLPTAEKPAHPQDASVELKNVTFSYDGNSNAIDNVSLKIRQGQTVAFVGPSGGGKTTLANLITRFFDPQSGEVIIGGANVRDIEKGELMSTVSFVFQNSRLLKKSIYENVRLAKPDATREEVTAALEQAQCTDIIEKFPTGIDTVIGTKGVYLSGGEMQRIAIARAILKNSPIVVLDEATAFADPDNELKVQQALSSLSQGKTVIMIAHRLSTVANADCIYVLRDGKIAEQGTGRELAEKGGLFSEMFKNYMSSVKWKIAKEEQ